MLYYVVCITYILHILIKSIIFTKSCFELLYLKCVDTTMINSYSLNKTSVMYVNEYNIIKLYLYIYN